MPSLFQKTNKKLGNALNVAIFFMKMLKALNRWFLVKFAQMTSNAANGQAAESVFLLLTQEF
jgi:hypothetical protein